MGNKDKTRDGDATATDRDHRDSHANRDHSWDWEAASDTALARTIAEAVAVVLVKQKAEETQSITEAFTRQMEKAHVQYEKHFKESHAATLPTTLKVTSSTDGFRVMDHLTGQWTRMSTRDGSFGHIRLDSHWMQWKETLRRPRSPTCTIGLMMKAFPKLKDGKTARFSSAKKSMTN